jgi:hypothetical protein
MQFQLFIYLIPLLLSPIISIMIGIHTWRQRRHSAPGAIWLGMLTFATGWWGLCYLMQIFTGANLQTQIFWNTVRQVGANTVSLFLFLFVLEYTGRKDWITRRMLSGLFGTAAIATLIAFTNEAHHLYWVTYKLAQNGPLLLLAFTRGSLNFAYILFNYVLILTSTILLFQWMVNNAQSLYR